MRFLSLYFICHHLDTLALSASLVKHCEGCCSALFAIDMVGQLTSTILRYLEWIPEVSDTGT